VVVHQPVLWQGLAAGPDDLQVLWDEEGSLDKKGKGWLREHHGASVSFLHIITSADSFSFFGFRELSL
jgi:hypothetical protein